MQATICLRVTIHVGSERLQRMKALKKIYREIAAWQQDSECVPRICSAVNPFADLVVVGEAIGPDTVRCSGVNYFRLDGHLGDSGQNLEEILSRVGLTLYPGSDLRLPTGRVLEASLGGGRQTVYSTDLCPEYPGHIGRPVIVHAAAGFVLVHNHPSGDARPSAADVRLTQRVVKGARILEVEFLDHVIVGRRIRKHPGYFSFQEAGLL